MLIFFIFLFPRSISTTAAARRSCMPPRLFSCASRVFLQRRAPLPIIETQKSPWNVSDRFVSMRSPSGSSSNLCRNSPRTKSSELSSHQMSVRVLVRQEVQDFSASRCPFEVISECSLLTRTHSLMGRVPLQLKGCPTVPSSSLTTPQETSRFSTCTCGELRHCSIFRLYGAVATAYPFAGVPLCRCLLPHGTSTL